MTPAERIRGCLLGGAVGDALGTPVEFQSWARIRAVHGPEGVTELSTPGRFTDDTQMSLFTAEGLIRASVRRGPEETAIQRPPSIMPTCGGCTPRGTRGTSRSGHWTGGWSPTGACIDGRPRATRACRRSATGSPAPPTIRSTTRRAAAASCGRRRWVCSAKATRRGSWGVRSLRSPTAIPTAGSRPAGWP